MPRTARTCCVFSWTEPHQMACWRRPMAPLKLSFRSHYYRLNQPDPISTSAAWFFKFVGVFALVSPLG
jgi:hypothetical protein